MEIISEQSSDAEYNQSSQPNKAQQFNALSRKSKDGSFIRVDSEQDQEKNFKKKNWEDSIKEHVRINCRFDNDIDDSIEEEINQMRRQNPTQFRSKDIQSKGYQLSDGEDSDFDFKQRDNKTTVGVTKQIQNDSSTKQYEQYKNQYKNDNIELSSDSDSEEFKKIQRKYQIPPLQSKEHLVEKENPQQNKYMQNDFLKNGLNFQENIQQYRVGNPSQLTKSGTTFDKTVSEIDLEESIQDPKKDTFYRLREDLMKQLDSERDKNRMMEQKLICRDKSFIEIKSQFNELLFNYESKNRECEMLRKNQNLNNGILNQSHHSIASCKTSKKPNTSANEGSNHNSIERKYNQLLSKYKNDSDNDSSEIESEYKIKNEKDTNLQRKQNDNSIKVQHYNNNEVDSSNSRGIRKNSQQEIIPLDPSAQKKQVENDLLLRKVERQMAEITRLNKELDDTKFDNNKQSQKIADLEMELANANSKKNEKQENKLQQLKQNNALLFSQLEESLENQKMSQLEINSLKEIIKDREDKLKGFKNDESDNQALLEKAERLLKNFDALKVEHLEQSQELVKVMKENKELKEKQQEGKELQQLREFAEQQDTLIQRLSNELQNQKQDYQIQLDHATRNLLDLVKRVFGQRGDFLCSPEQSYIWISEALGKEVNISNQNEYDNSDFKGDSERQQLKEIVHFSTILKDAEQIQRDYDRYKEFAKVFKDMIKSIAKNELNQQPTLKDCWKYFKWIYQHYIKLKLEDQMNQSTTNILLKMLKLKNEHEIIVAVQNLITSNDRLKHIQSLMTSQTPSSLQLNIQSTQQTPNHNFSQQQNNYLNNFDYQISQRGGGKENKPENNQQDNRIQNNNLSKQRSKSPIVNSSNPPLQKNININQNRIKREIPIYSPMSIAHSQGGDHYLLPNQFSQESVGSSYRLPYSYNTYTGSMNLDSQMDSQYHSSSIVQRSFQGEVRMNNNKNSKTIKDNQNKRGNNQNNRSMPRLITNQF